jgi:hypothetical protein
LYQHARQGRSFIVGEVILKHAAVEDIFADVKVTYARAQARGDVWLAHAQARLGNAMKMAEMLTSRQAATQAQLEPLAAALAAQDKRAVLLIGEVADEIWNKLGRPAGDASYDVVFPEGIKFYTSGPSSERPGRMLLLAELLEMKLLARISDAQAKDFAQRLRDEADSHAKLVAQVGVPRMRVQLLTQEKTALARAAQMALSSLKRAYLNEGLTETEIHTVIPDHPRRKAAATGNDPGEAPDAGKDGNS